MLMTDHVATWRPTVPFPEGHRRSKGRDLIGVDRAAVSTVTGHPESNTIQDDHATDLRCQIVIMANDIGGVLRPYPGS